MRKKKKVPLISLAEPLPLWVWKASYTPPGQEPSAAELFTKHDAGKPRLGLIPPEMLTALAKVLTHGADKYSDHNWRNGADWSRYYDAALRHMNDWWGGENVDKETGESHLAHALACLTFLLVSQKRNYGKDNRVK